MNVRPNAIRLTRINVRAADHLGPYVVRKNVSKFMLSDNIMQNSNIIVK